MRYLTVGSLWKNENDYALDFLRYHRLVGVEHFIIYIDDIPGESSLETLLKNESDVEIVRFSSPDKQLHQTVWGELIKRSRGQTKWLALIDADQCLVPVKTDDVRTILKDYEEFACLQLNWKAFGSSFNEKKLPGSVYERFLLCAKPDSSYNYPTQFICQPDRTLPIKVAEPHYALLPVNEKAVNTNKEEISRDKVVDMNPNTPLSFNVPPLHDVMWVAHYTNKSKEEWIVKNNRGRADIIGQKMPFSQFDEYEAECNGFKEERVLELWKKAQILALKDLSYRLGYWTACWDDGANVTTKELEALRAEVEKFHQDMK